MNNLRVLLSTVLILVWSSWPVLASMTANQRAAELYNNLPKIQNIRGAVWKNTTQNGNTSGCSYIGTYNNGLYMLGSDQSGANGTANAWVYPSVGLTGTSPIFQSLSRIPQGQDFFSKQWYSVAYGINDKGVVLGFGKFNDGDSSNDKGGYFFNVGQIDPTTYKIKRTLHEEMPSDMFAVVDFWGDGSSATNTRNGGAGGVITYNGSVMVPGPSTTGEFYYIYYNNGNSRFEVVVITPGDQNWDFEQGNYVLPSFYFDAPNFPNKYSYDPGSGMIYAKFIETTTNERYIYLVTFNQDGGKYAYGCLKLDRNKKTLDAGWNLSKSECENGIYYMNIEYGGDDNEGLMIASSGPNQFPVVYHHPVDSTTHMPGPAKKCYIMDDKVWSKIDDTSGDAVPVMGFITPTLVETGEYNLVYNLVTFVGDEPDNSAVILGIQSTETLTPTQNTPYIMIKTPYLYLCPGIGEPELVKFDMTIDTGIEKSQTETQENSFGFFGIAYSTMCSTTDVSGVTIDKSFSVAINSEAASATHDYVGAYNNESGNTVYLETMKYLTCFVINQLKITTTSLVGSTKWQIAESIPNSIVKGLQNVNISESANYSGTMRGIGASSSDTKTFSWGISASSPSSFSGATIPVGGYSTGWSSSITKSNEYHINWKNYPSNPQSPNKGVTSGLHFLFGNDAEQLNLPSGIFVVWPFYKWQKKKKTDVAID